MSSNEIKPNYYAIIPANVRYDDELCANAKLLYGEITSLCNSKGYCWASNQYFSKLYNCSDRTIQNLIKQLSDKNYIKVQIFNKTKRLIYIDFTTYENNFVGGVKNISYPHEKNFTHNNKENNKEEYNNEFEQLNDFLTYNWLD